MTDRPIFVIDTNILVDYPDIIPPENGEVELKEPTVDLAGALIVIPTAVIRELSSFKKEKSERGKVARGVLKRLRGQFEKLESTIESSYRLSSTVTLGDRAVSILPVHKDFKKALPFAPSEEDMDGQIILAVLTIEFLAHGFPIDGTAKPDNVVNMPLSKQVTLLTNDNGLAIRARRRGIITSRYGYMPPPAYTGRREVSISEDLLTYFMENRKIEHDIWDVMTDFDDEPPFVANEFIIMKTDTSSEYPYCNNIGRYDAEADAIVALEYANQFPERVTNCGQAIYAEALMNPKFSAVICKGPAGSGKTYMATVYGYNACKNGEFIGVTVVPCASQSRIGALPGDLNDKMDPDVQPLKNALRNYLLKTDRGLKAELKDLQEHGAGVPRPSENLDEDNRSIRQKLHDRVDAIWDAWFSNLPIESARGRDFSYEVALYDEFQDQNATQADTLIKRLGMNGKIVITGDIEQVHAPYLDSCNNGLVYASQLLLDNPMVAQVCFTEEEVIRHPLVKEVTERQKNSKSNPYP